MSLVYITEQYYLQSAANDRWSALMNAGFEVVSYTLNHVYYIRFKPVHGKVLP